MAQLWEWEGGTGKKEHKEEHRILPFPKEKASPDPLAEFSVQEGDGVKKRIFFSQLLQTRN